MKKLVIALLFSLLPLGAFAAQGQMGIAAIVNDEIITTSDVTARVALALQGANMKPDAKFLEGMKKQALDALIDEQIRLQEARRLGVSPAKEQVDETIAKMAQQNGTTAENFKKVLSSQPGVYESLRRQMETQAAWTNVIKRKVRPQVNVSEEDITNYLTEKEKNPAKVEFMVAEIFLRNNENNQQLAQQLIKELRSGKQRFSVVAKQFSQGLEASKGGLLGWIPEGTLEPALDAAIKNTPIGQLSDPVISSRGIHILLVRERKDILATQQASQRLNLKQVVVPLPKDVPPKMMEQAMAQAKFFYSEAKDCAAMDALIKKVNHPMSRDLGSVRLGDMPPPVVRLVKDMPENKPTEPVRAADGLAVFMVCGRQDDAGKTVRDDVANIIGAERLNRLQSRYYRDLRSAAYVDIRQN
jgi:peptidyl-prolyl cis-trans isomerase SurA